MLNKITGLGWQILTQAVTFLCLSATPNVRGLRKQTGTQVQEVIMVSEATVCLIQLMPVAHCVRLITNDLVMEHSTVDKAKGFNRIQMPFTFPLEELF